MNKKVKIAVIGAGNVGSAIAQFLSDNNMLEWVIARSNHSYNRIKNFVPENKIIRNVSETTQFPELTILAVSDNSIRAISYEISQLFPDLINKRFSHCSGTLGKEELILLEKNGAKVAALHPYQTFFNSSKETLDNIPWGIDCHKYDEKEFSEFVSMLNGKPVILSEKAKNEKELYHISAIVASNYLNTLLSLSSELLKKIDMKPEVFLKTIIDTTLNNNYKSLHTENISPLTGPIVRGEANIIKRHLNALSKYPELINQYKLIGMATLRTAYNKNLLSEKTYIEIKTLLV